MDRIIDMKSFDFKNSQIIKPPENDVSKVYDMKKYYTLIIDSRDRDINFFPTPSQYEINLDDPIEDVCNAEIIVTDVPLSSYIVNINNNVFTVNFNNNETVISIDPGNYTEIALAQTLQSCLSNQIGGVQWNIVYDPIKDNFEFWTDQLVTINFINIGCSRLLGFAFQSYSSIIVPPNIGLTHKIKSIYRKNFSDNRYIVMSIDQFTINTSMNNTIQKSSVVLQKRFVDTNVFADHPIKKFFNPRIARLAKIKVTFEDYYGNLYDFQNADHCFQIFFECHKQHIKYSH